METGGALMEKKKDEWKHGGISHQLLESAVSLFTGPPVLMPGPLVPLQEQESPTSWL